MILGKNRIFRVEAPSETAKLFIVFCEGAKREYDYFNYFAELDSRLNIEVIGPEDGDDNSPRGLINSARSILFPEVGEPKYQISNTDEVWFVIDTDKWGEKIDIIYSESDKYPNWKVAQSNPCFELWLLYHFIEKIPEFEGMSKSSSWKSFLNRYVPGGFDSKKHPILIRTAIDNSKLTYSEDKRGQPTFLATSVFNLAENIYSIIGKKIESARWKYTNM